MEAFETIYRYTLGKDGLAQIIQAFLMVFIVYAIMMGGSSLMNAIMTYNNSSAMILPYLYNGPQTIQQDPNQKNSITIYPSVNAPSGLEFSYSCYLLIEKSSFTGTSTGLKHVFHKGSQHFKPLMCPGVFMMNAENTMRVYMNEAGSWDTHCDIPNIPIDKWFHLAIVVRNMNVDIFINGNVVYRMTLKSVPKQNFGNVYVFNNEPFSDSTTAPPDNVFNVIGSVDGFISSLQYSGFALNYEQIDRMLRRGPSKKMVSASQNLPPYLNDSWWVTYYNRHS
jgi:hypothetical protein